MKRFRPRAKGRDTFNEKCRTKRKDTKKYWLDEYGKELV